MVYTMDGEDIQLIIRRDVKGIKVGDASSESHGSGANYSKMTLGEIPIPKDEEFEINPFDWAQISAEAHTSAVKELADLKSKMQDSESKIESLTKQLDDFLTAKKQAETEMFEKFKILLNEKKKKIRDQQRLLAGATVDKRAGMSRAP
jgi:septal ring factor EnvC (AmiA/AmiB activator)